MREKRKGMTRKADTGQSVPSEKSESESGGKKGR